MVIEPSRPPGDAPCPRCGTLLWFESRVAIQYLRKRRKQARRVHETPLTNRKPCPFTLIDCKNSLQSIRRIEPLYRLMRMIPGLRQWANLLEPPDDIAGIERIVGIINSMTPQERKNPSLINFSRRCRIAAGSGTEICDVDRLLNEFFVMADLMEKTTGMGRWQQFQHFRRLARAAFVTSEYPSLSGR